MTSYGFILYPSKRVLASLIQKYWNKKLTNRIFFLIAEVFSQLIIMGVDQIYTISISSIEIVVVYFKTAVCGA